MKKISVIILILFSKTVYGFDLHIEGPDVTCPNEDITYHVYATGAFGEKMNGMIAWSVYIDGVFINELSSTLYSCGGMEKDFYINPIVYDEFGQPEYGWRDVGLVQLHVSFKGGAFCFDLSKSLWITSRAVEPGLPATENGALTFCPGEPKTVYLDPGMPGIFLSPENCYFHHNFTWTVPSGWTVTNVSNPSTGTFNEFITPNESVKVTAPTGVIPGTNNLFITVVADGDFAEWLPLIQREISVGPPANVSISGVNTLCTSNSTFTLQNVPSGSSVAWSVSPSGYFSTTSGSGSSFVTHATSSGNDQGVVTASVSGSCGNAVINKNVWVGKAKVSGTPFSLVANGNEGANPFPCISTLSDPKVYYWEVPVDDRYRLEGEDYLYWVYDAFNANVTYDYYNEGGYTWGLWMDLHSWSQYANGYSYLGAHNTCGDVTVASMGWAMCSGGYYSIYPNPASEALFISINDENEENLKVEKVSREKKSFQIEIMDDYQQVHLRQNEVNANDQIDISSLNPGVYYLKIKEARSEEVHRVLIE